MWPLTKAVDKFLGEKLTKNPSQPPKHAFNVQKGAKIK